MTVTMSRKELAALGVTVAPKAVPAMNQTEARYADLLELRKRAGEVREYAYQLLTVRLGDDLRFTPDFTVILASGALELHEVKGGYIREDARVKLHAAAAGTPFRYVLAQWTKEKGWVIEAVAP